MIEKAQYDAIQKALNEQKEQLEKAAKALAEFEAKEKEAIAKARKADILAAVEAEDTADKLFKAVGELAPEAFNDVVEVLKGLNVKVEKSLLFTEQGSKAEVETRRTTLRCPADVTHFLNQRYEGHVMCTSSEKKSVSQSRYGLWGCVYQSCVQAA